MAPRAGGALDPPQGRSDRGRAILFRPAEEAKMDDVLRKKVLDLLDEHRIMSLATTRPDGWPQATTVGYVSEGLTLYFMCGRDSQKARNIARDNRVSLT